MQTNSSCPRVCLPSRKNPGGGGGLKPPTHTHLTPTTRPIPLSVYNGVNKSAVFRRQRPYHAENTSSRPITEVKQHRARLVLGWVTAWEHRVSLSFSLVGYRLFTGTNCFLELDTHVLNVMMWAARARPDTTMHQLSWPGPCNHRSISVEIRQGCCKDTPLAGRGCGVHRR